MKLCSRRYCLKTFFMASCSFMFPPLVNAIPTVALPIILFHKVTESPQYPEDISSSQLFELLTFIWSNGFVPVNFSDCLTGKISSIVPKGLKPICLTMDDSHPSIFFNAVKYTHPDMNNKESFLDIFAQSLIPFKLKPRATIFLSRINNDRISTLPKAYFGGLLPLREILLKINEKQHGVECGYHSKFHLRMKKMTREEVRAVLQEQIEDFKSLDVEKMISKVFAFPYGLPPDCYLRDIFEDLGFYGAALAQPGKNEGTTNYIQSNYDGSSLIDSFNAQRVSIGSFLYPKNFKGKLIPISPIEDFKKDVLNTPTPVVIQN